MEEADPETGKKKKDVFMATLTHTGDVLFRLNIVVGHFITTVCVHTIGM